MSTPISEMMTWAARSPIPGIVASSRICGSKGRLASSMRVSSRAIMSVRWSMCSRCRVHISACWSPKRPAHAILSSGIFLRITPRARSASTAGARSPFINAPLLSLPPAVVSVEATESILIPLSSRTLPRRCSSLALLDELLAVASQLPDRGDLRWRDEAAAEQPALGQLRQPHRVEGIAFATRDVLDVPGIDQQHLHRALGRTQGMEDRLPVDPGGFHGHVRDALGYQPGHHLGQRLVEGVVLADLLSALAGVLAGGAHRHRDDLLSDVDRGHPFIDDLHVGLPSSRPVRRVDRGARMKIRV